MESIVCEGGPILAAQLIAAGIVDELCLSTSPVIGGSDKQLLPHGVAIDKRVTLEQLVLDDASGLYARWSIER
jgi:riboflavin biosynthesis pyrimidine reductase